MGNLKATAAPLTTPNPTIWLTRDSDRDGILSETVDVWKKRPERWHDDATGVTWLWANTEDDAPERVPVVTAAKRFRTLPSNDLECVRIG